MDSPADSIQCFIFDELYRKAIHRDAETLGMEICLPVWKHREFIDAHRYDHTRITTLLLVTTEETRLEDLLARKVATGDVGATANTIIVMGSERVGARLARMLCVVKHRGSAMSDEIAEYRIGPPASRCPERRRGPRQAQSARTATQGAGAPPKKRSALSRRSCADGLRPRVGPPPLLLVVVRDEGKSEPNMIRPVADQHSSLTPPPRADVGVARAAGPWWCRGRGGVVPVRARKRSLSNAPRWATHTRRRESAA
jgi:hypothetical protein